MQQVYWLHIETNTYLHSADKVIHFSSLICSAWSLYYLSAAIISKCSPLLHRQCIRSTDEKLQPLDWIKRFLAEFFHAAKRNAGNFIQTFWLNWWRRWRSLNIIQVLLSSKTGASPSLWAVRADLASFSCCDGRCVKEVYMDMFRTIRNSDLSQLGTKKISKGGWTVLELLSHEGSPPPPHIFAWCVLGSFFFTWKREFNVFCEWCRDWKFGRDTL